MLKLARPVIHSAMVAALSLSGCATNLQQADADAGVYCFRSRFHTATCTTHLPPPSAVEAEVLRFEPLAEAGTLYVIRNSGSDTVSQVLLSIDGREPVVTIPRSMIRARLAPGPHKLALEFKGKRYEQSISVGRGGLQYVEVKEMSPFSNDRYTWAELSAPPAKVLARASKLIADLDLR